MGLFNAQRSRCMLMIQVFALHLVGLLACLAYTVLAQFDVSEAVTASASLPDVAITCVGNLAVSCLLQFHRLGLEEVAAETCNNAQQCSLQFHHLRREEVTAKTRNNGHQCRCIVIEAVSDEHIKIIASWMPGALKGLSDSQCLLPCMTCLTNGCHGCNQVMLHVVEREWRLTEGGPKKWPVPAACEMLDNVESTIDEERNCICMPVRPVEDDEWTKMLIRCLKTKDKKDREVTTPASEALEKYIAQSGVCKATEEYSSVPLILPRVAEIVINIILTAWFRVDGFSSSLVARRVIRDYVVDSRGTGIAANAFLKKCEVYSNAENTNVCQVFTFRGNLLNFRTFSFIIGGVNLMCSIGWGVLIAIPGNWYDTLSMPPSKARIVILIAAIVIALLMDCLQFYLYVTDAINEYHNNGMLCAILLLVVVILEIVCMIVGSAVGGTLGIKGFGKWTYSAIQVLVWVKWGFGSYSLGAYSIENKDYRRPLAAWAFDVSAGHGLMCASAFLLNAVLAGVRGQWKYSQS